jgi:hypothetical protein
LPLCRNLDPDFGHDSQIVLPLTVTALAFDTATAQSLAVEFLAAMRAINQEAARSYFHWAIVTPAITNALCCEWWITSIKPFAATLRTKAAAVVSHTEAAGEAARGIDYRRRIGAQQIALDYSGNGGLFHP